MAGSQSPRTAVVLYVLQTSKLLILSRLLQIMARSGWGRQSRSSRWSSTRAAPTCGCRPRSAATSRCPACSTTSTTAPSPRPTGCACAPAPASCALLQDPLALVPCTVISTRLPIEILLLPCCERLQCHSTICMLTTSHRFGAEDAACAHHALLLLDPVAKTSMHSNVHRTASKS